MHLNQVYPPQKDTDIPAFCGGFFCFIKNAVGQGNVPFVLFYFCASSTEIEENFALNWVLHRKPFEINHDSDKLDHHILPYAILCDILSPKDNDPCKEDYHGFAHSSAKAL